MPQVPVFAHPEKQERRELQEIVGTMRDDIVSLEYPLRRILAGLFAELNSTGQLTQSLRDPLSPKSGGHMEYPRGVEVRLRADRPSTGRESSHNPDFCMRKMFLFAGTAGICLLIFVVILTLAVASMDRSVLRLGLSSS